MNAGNSRLAGLMRGLVTALGACLALVFGPFPSTPTVEGRSVDDRREPSIEQRVETLRQRYLSEPNPSEADSTPAERRPGRLTQWSNGPNSPNAWGNWQNWR